MQSMNEATTYSANITHEQLNALINTVACGNIDIDEVLDSIEAMSNKKILEQHAYAVTENRDGRFSTYVPDSTKPNRRRKIVKATREALEKEIIRYYKECERQKSLESICLKDFYGDWIDFKSLHTNSSAYIKTIDELWKRHYIHDSIIDIPFVKLDKYTLDTWAHRVIKENNMTKKQYYNMAIIIRQSLDLAVEKGIIPENPFSKVRVDAKLFRPVRKKADETQVYLLDEQPLVEKEAYADFERTGVSASLAIPFSFQTGLRISEVVALKWSDINEEIENCIHIQRMETREYEKLPDGSWSKEKYAVIERTKSHAGNRNVYLTSTARHILKQVREYNAENGYGSSEYIFLNHGERVTARYLNTILRRCCANAHISEKGMHKIRKTYISTLIDNEDININFIREQVGHTDERTTYGNYCYNRKNPVQTAQAMEKALAHTI